MAMYQKGDGVMFKGKYYTILSVMTHPDANWRYALLDPSKPNTLEGPTVFNHQLDEFYKENEQPRLF